jgi:hypothetical protein
MSVRLFVNLDIFLVQIGKIASNSYWLVAVNQIQLLKITKKQMRHAQAIGDIAKRVLGTKTSPMLRGSQPFGQTDNFCTPPEIVRFEIATVMSGVV